MSQSTSRPPIFILSCYRTGSTLLRYILDTHPEIYGPPEVYLGQTALTMARLAAGIAAEPFDWLQPEAASPKILDEIRTRLLQQMNRATEGQGKRLWCEKTPNNLAPPQVRILGALFPDAKYICLHRHCLDVAQSIVKVIHRLEELQPFLLGSRGDALRAAVDYWNERTFTSISFEFEKSSRCFRLRYEDLVSGPEKVLDRMFAFLDLAWDRRLLEAVFSSRHVPGEEDHYIRFTDSIHAQSVGLGRDLSLQGLPERSFKGMRSLLSTLGYPERPVPLASEGAGASQEPASGSKPSVQWFFETHLPERFLAEPRLVASFKRTYQLAVLGDGGGTWILDPRQGKVAAGLTPAACRIEVHAADLFEIARGTLHPWKASEQGRLRIQGNADMAELQNLVQLFHFGAPAAQASVLAHR